MGLSGILFRYILSKPDLSVNYGDVIRKMLLI